MYKLVLTTTSHQSFVLKNYGQTLSMAKKCTVEPIPDLNIFYDSKLES